MAHFDFTTPVSEKDVRQLRVDDTVTLTHVPVTSGGCLATPEGQILDARYPWMVVLRLSVAPVA